MEEEIETVTLVMTKSDQRDLLLVLVLAGDVAGILGLETKVGHLKEVIMPGVYGERKEGL